MGQTATNDELLARWRDEPAPLLPLLHAFHDRDGFLSEEALRFVAAGLRIPLADLYGTVTFYHHFARDPGGRESSRVCVGPVCVHRGAEALAGVLEARGERVDRIPCPGRCDEPVPVIRGDIVVTGSSVADLANGPTPLPAARPDGVEECVFRHIRRAGRATLAGYRDTGGFAALEAAVAGTPAALVDTLDASGLAGRGGAGFPTGRKWRAVAEAEGDPKTIVCNADEGEPGCFKDRVLLDHDPYALIEGMALAAFATGAPLGFIYLRYEYPETLGILEEAITAAAEAGFLGERILGRDGFDFRLLVRRGAGAYICGEETSLLNSLEGRHPFPRNRPPFPVTHGYEDRPTVVNNVETLCSVPPIVRKGAEWYRSLGLGEHAGTKVISLSGDVRRPGNYEVPLGLPLSTLLDEWAGGPLPDRSIQAVTMAGLSGGFLAGTDLGEVTLDEPSIRSRKSFLGAGGIMVFDDTRDMVAVAHSAMEFFAEESCGKCFPCRIGTRRLTERLNGGGPPDLTQWIDEVADLNQTMKTTSACGLGQAAPLVTESLLRYFPDQVARHVGAARGTHELEETR
jgi:NADH-quinone oxidoreductase subunit F